MDIKKLNTVVNYFETGEVNYEIEEIKQFEKLTESIYDMLIEYGEIEEEDEDEDEN